MMPSAMGLDMRISTSVLGSTAGRPRAESSWVGAGWLRGSFQPTVTSSYPTGRAYHSRMPRTTPFSQMNLTELIGGFVAAVERATVDRVKELVLGALGRSEGSRNGAALTPLKRKLPKQLCPVPGCRNVAAPIFGMVCRDHKDVPKAKIKKYREERRANGAGAVVRRGRPPGKRAAKATRKAAARRALAAVKRPGRKARRKKATAATATRRNARKAHIRGVTAIATPPAASPPSTNSNAPASA
jgi:hypothetical protein